MLWWTWQFNATKAIHYNDVIISAMASHIRLSRLFDQPFVQAQIKENATPRHWPLCPVTGGLPSQKASKVEYVCIWWRHHEKLNCFRASNVYHMQVEWTSYHMRKIVGCACAENAENVFPATDFNGNRYLAIPACITVRASRTCRDACRDR